MTPHRALPLLGLLAAAAVSCATPASAAHTRLEHHNSVYEVSPAMMHAIDVIVAEKMKMMRRR